MTIFSSSVPALWGLGFDPQAFVVLTAYATPGETFSAQYTNVSYVAGTAPAPASGGIFDGTTGAIVNPSEWEGSIVGDGTDTLVVSIRPVGGWAVNASYDSLGGATVSGSLSSFVAFDSGVGNQEVFTPDLLPFYTGGGPCVCAAPFTSTRVDPTHVRLDFTDPVLLIPTLTWPGAYEFTPPLAVVSVTAGPATAGIDYDTVEYVTLTTEEQAPVNPYTVRAFGLEGA